MADTFTVVLFGVFPPTQTVERAPINSFLSWEEGRSRLLTKIKLILTTYRRHDSAVRRYVVAVIIAIFDVTLCSRYYNIVKRILQKTISNVNKVYIV